MNQNTTKTNNSKVNNQKDEKFSIMMIFNPVLWLMLSLTLGLAPLFPEPHIVGKIRWIWGGAVGMKTIDWLDFLMHGTPFLMLFITLIIIVNKKFKERKELSENK